MLSADFLRARPEYRNPRPGTMRSTIADETRMYAWSPLSYHWFKFSVAEMLLAGGSFGYELIYIHHVVASTRRGNEKLRRWYGHTRVTTSGVGAIVWHWVSYPSVRHVDEV